MKRGWLAALAALVLLLDIAGAEGMITSLKQLNAPEMTVGVDLGSAAETLTRELLPKAQVAVYNDKPAAYLAVAQGKLDAFVYDYNQLNLALESGVAGVHLLDETLGDPIRIAVGISPVSKIPDLEDKLNRFIAEARADGTLDDMYRRWVLDGDETMPDIPLPESPDLRLVVGTSGIVPPHSYYVGTELAGDDIELARRFAAWLGAELQFKVYDYGAIINAAVSGDVDCVMANLNITPERAEALSFSDVLYEDKLGVLVRGDARQGAGRQVPAGAFTALDQLGDKRIGIPSGTNFDLLVDSALPGAEKLYYNSQSDLLAALTAGKIDAFPSDEPVIQYIMGQRSDITYIPEYLEPFDFAYCFAKTERGQALRDEFSEFIRGLRDDGSLDALTDEWFSADEGVKALPEIDALPATKGTLVMATDGDYMPFEYVRDGEVVGYDVDIAALFCEARGYGLKIEVMNLDGILPAVQSGKCDFGGSALTITPERAESVLFSEPNYAGGAVMVVLRSEDTAAAADDSSQAGVAASFNKTFVREERWKLFVEGVLTTLLITLLAILFGTILGFAVFMLCRNGNPAANLITRFCLWLVQGMPMVVLLMILYYIVFGSVAISGVAVAVIGFTLTFGAAVFGLFMMGVGAVEVGQYEAACALGYSNRRTFFRIILPQALPHVLPAYRGEIVGLIKATAIVGYIAVQDLTKMGDIVRSRTYEAFFPLIAVTVIYFALEALIGFLVSRVTLGFNPKRRKPADILKGIRTEDQD